MPDFNAPEYKAIDRAYDTGRNEAMFPLLNLSQSARAYHDEYWEWIWHGTDTHRTIGDKKTELRARHGQDAEDELMQALRAAGLLGS